jgi:hypothetical protein
MWGPVVSETMKGEAALTRGPDSSASPERGQRAVAAANGPAHAARAPARRRESSGPPCSPGGKEMQADPNGPLGRQVSR